MSTVVMALHFTPITPMFIITDDNVHTSVWPSVWWTVCVGGRRADLSCVGTWRCSRGLVGKGWGGVCRQFHVPGTWTHCSSDIITLITEVFYFFFFLLHCSHKSCLMYWTFPNQILFVAAIRDYAYGGIAIDDIVLSPECVLSNGTLWFYACLRQL